MLRALAFLVAVGFLSRCVPDLAVDESTITEPQILGVIAEPAEAAPGAPVTFKAIWADPSGSGTGPTNWEFCSARKKLTELSAVSAVCTQDGEHLIPIPAGATTAADLPKDGCERFGPNPPPAAPGEPAGRPSDADLTGGYYQPVRLVEPTGISIARVRLTCGTSGTTQAVAAEFAQRYHTNQNPAASELAIVAADGTRTVVPPAGNGTPPDVRAGETVTLELGWPVCPSADVCDDGTCGPSETATLCPSDCAPTPVGCGGAERYVVYDRQSRTIAERRESIGLSWFATAGTYREPRNGTASDDLTAARDNTWTAPESAGEVRLWVVLRDDRGGAGSHEWEVTQVEGHDDRDTCGDRCGKDVAVI